MQRLNERRKSALKQLEQQLSTGTKPTKLSAAKAAEKGLTKYDGKFREPLSAIDVQKKQREIDVLKQRIK